MNSREDYRMGYLWQTDELICYDVINPTQYVFHEDTETCTPVYTKYDEDYEKFYAAALLDVEEAKKTREYGLDIVNHPNWFDASFISWLSYDSLHLEQIMQSLMAIWLQTYFVSWNKKSSLS